MKSIRRSPFYAKWDNRTVERILQYSLVNDGDRVRTSTARDMEVAMLGRLNLDGVGQAESPKNAVEVTDSVPDLDPTVGGTYPFYRPEAPAIYKLLPSLRPSCLFVASAHSPSSRPDFRNHWLASTGTGVGGSGGASAGRVAVEVLAGNSHALPMDENLPEVVRITERWITREVGRWHEQEAEFQRPWERKALSEKQTLHPLTKTIIRDYQGNEPLEDFMQRVRRISKL